MPALPCILGQHKHGPVAHVNRRLYSECYHCGSDLIRRGRRWRRARADELPRSWKAKRQAAPEFPLPLAVLAMTIALLGAVFYIGVL